MLHITPSERAALKLLAAGKARHEIADHLQISENGVDAHLAMLFTRMGVAGPAEAVRAAFRRGLLIPEDSESRRDEVKGREGV